MDPLEALQNVASAGIYNIGGAAINAADAQLSPYENGQANYYPPQTSTPSSSGFLNSGMLVLIVVALFIWKAL